MEKLYFNLSEEEFTKGRKILLWIFVGAFFIGGVYVAMLSPVFGVHHIKPVLSLAPFGISLLVGIIAAFATIKRSDLFFLVDDDKIEFRYGLFKPKKHSFLWTDIKEFVMPHKQRKVKILFHTGPSYVIDLSWLQRKKSTLIRKHLFHVARSKNINVIKVLMLPKEA
ncbi:MAG: hypothetical protein QG611_471 [Bacteroidota bacterium]|nr:hypothetical protein [Bacteroidota bacterium]